MYGHEAWTQPASAKISLVTLDVSAKHDYSKSVMHAYTHEAKSGLEQPYQTIPNHFLLQTGHSHHLCHLCQRRGAAAKV